MATLLLDDEVVEAPPPSGPSVVSNNLWRREAGDNGDGEPIARGIDPNGTFVDWRTGHERLYEYRVEAIGDNGTVTFGTWT